MSLFVRIGVFGTALAVSACGADLGEGYDEDSLGKSESGVEGGTLVSSGKGAVSIQVNGHGTCSGVIIGPRTLLTSAHCVKNAGYGDVDIEIMVHYRDNGTWWCLSEPATTNARCSAYADGYAWVNPAFEAAQDTGAAPESNKDIAVVSLNANFSYIGPFHRHHIMKQPTVAAIGDFNAIGYGWTSDSNSNSSDLPYEAQFQLAKVSGSYYYSWGGRLVGQNGDSGMRLCSGDSGSPQFETSGGTNYLFGLHSQRDPRNGSCAELDVRQYGVQVGPYVPEIEAHLGRSCRSWSRVGLGPMADCWP